MNTVIVKLDLDRYEVDVIERLVVDRVISVSEAVEHVIVKNMSDYQRLKWVRKVEGLKRAG